MEGAAGQIALPVLGIIAAAAATFYVVSFSELREKSFEDLDGIGDESLDELKSLASSRQRRARRKAEREDKKQ